MSDETTTYAARMSVAEMQKRKAIEGRPYPLTDRAKEELATEFDRLFTLSQNHHPIVGLVEPSEDRHSKPEFRLNIELGNAEMQSGEQIAEALREVADELEWLSLDGKIFDVNGNTVGSYRHVKASD